MKYRYYDFPPNTRIKYEYREECDDPEYKDRQGVAVGRRGADIYVHWDDGKCEPVDYTLLVPLPTEP